MTMLGNRAESLLRGFGFPADIKDLNLKDKIYNESYLESGFNVCIFRFIDISLIGSPLVPDPTSLVPAIRHSTQIFLLTMKLQVKVDRVEFLKPYSYFILLKTTEQSVRIPACSYAPTFLNSQKTRTSSITLSWWTSRTTYNFLPALFWTMLERKTRQDRLWSWGDANYPSRNTSRRCRTLQAIKVKRNSYNNRLMENWQSVRHIIN